MNNNYLSRPELIQKVNLMEQDYNKLSDRLRVVEHELAKVQYVITKLHLDKKEEQVKLID